MRKSGGEGGGELEGDTWRRFARTRGAEGQVSEEDGA